MSEPVRLNEWTKDEFFEVARRVKSGITTEEYDAMWDDFVEKKLDGRFERAEQ